MKFGMNVFLLLLAGSTVFAMEQQNLKEPYCKEQIISDGTIVTLNNGTKFDIYLRINSEKPFMRLKPKEKHFFKSEDVKTIEMGYVDYARFTITSQWTAIDIRNIEGCYWLTSVEAKITAGYRNCLYLSDFKTVELSPEAQNQETAHKWAEHLFEISAAKKLASKSYADKDEIEKVYREITAQINQSQWVSATFTNRVRELFFDKLNKAFETIITPIDIQFKNETKYNLLVKINKQPSHELTPNETHTINTLNLKTIKVGYQKPGFSIGLTNRWTHLDKQELENRYQQQAILVHVKPALNNNLDITDIESEGKLLDFCIKPEKLTEENFDNSSGIIYPEDSEPSRN